MAKHDCVDQSVVDATKLQPFLLIFISWKSHFSDTTENFFSLIP